VALHQKQVGLCNGNHCISSGRLPEIIFCEHSSPCHPQTQVKALSYKNNPYISMLKKHCRLLWAKAHLKRTEPKWKTVLCSDKLKFKIPFGKYGLVQIGKAPSLLIGIYRL